MKLLQSIKGQSNFYVPITGFILIVGIVIIIWYYNYHQRDVVIHPPHIEVQ